MREALRRFLDEGLRTGRRVDLRDHQRRRLVERADARGAGGPPGSRRAGCAAEASPTTRGRDQRMGGVPDDPLRGAGRPWPRLRRRRAHGRGPEPPTAPGTSGAGHGHDRPGGEALLASVASATRDPPATPREQCTAMVRRKAQMVDQRRATRARATSWPRRPGGVRPHRGARTQVAAAADRGVPERPRPSAGLQEVAGRCREANLAVYSLDCAGSCRWDPGPSRPTRARRTGAELGQMRTESSSSRRRATWAWPRTRGHCDPQHQRPRRAAPCAWREESRVYYLLGFAPPGERARATGAGSGWR